MTPQQLETALADLDPDALDSLAHLLRERAACRRRRLTVDEARAAVAGAQISEAWQSSRMVDIGRLRRGTAELIVGGWEPPQIVDALAEVGLADAFPDGETIAMAIAAGIADARRLQR